MAAVLASLVPVFLVIIAGWAARVTGFVEERHWPGLEKVTYVIFFPAIIIYTLARADLSQVPVLGMGGAMIAAILIIATLLLAARRMLSAQLAIDGPAFTSLFQGCTRWNTFVGARGRRGHVWGTRAGADGRGGRGDDTLAEHSRHRRSCALRLGKASEPSSIAAYGGDKPVHLVLGHRDHPECRRLADSGSDRIDGGDPR